MSNYPPLTLLVLVPILLAPLACVDETITLVDVDGGDVTLEREAGQVVLLHFWATWCPSCIADIEHLQSGASQCRDDQVHVVTVNVGEAEEVVRKFVKQHGVRLPVLRDPDAELWRATGARGLPANLFWSDIGERTSVGSRNAMEWESLLAAQGCDQSAVQ